MWSLTSPHEQRTSGSKKIRSSVKKDFFNTIRRQRTFAGSPFLTLAVWKRRRCYDSLVILRGD
jgi:hypothetical protein